MLRLWPEQISIGLFVGRSWLRRRGKSSEVIGSSHDDAAALTCAMDALLAQAKPVHGARLDLIVSDGFAHIAPLPWQQRLGSESELRAYAEAAFAAGGIPLNENWICVPAVRRYGEQGLACALPAEWLSALEETAGRHGARLRSIMPLSAAAYWSPRRWMVGKGSSWFLIEDKDRATLLCFDGRRSTVYDTQPTSDDRGLRQLLQRHALTGVPKCAAVWGMANEQYSTMLEAIAPDVKVRVLPHDYWNLHA